MDRFDRFIGTWVAKRTIVDHRAGEAHMFLGEAVLTRGGFREAGRIRIGNSELEAVRAYRLVVADAHIEVLHKDGSAFVSLRVSDRQAVRHVCGDDLYAGRFLFRSETFWAESWRVFGPRKHYTSLTLYSRPEARRG